MHAVEAVLGDRSGVGDSPGDSGELLHDQSPVALANGPSALPVHSEGGASPGDVGRQTNAHRVRLASPSDTVISA